MELGSSQISSLMETLPGIAQVLRSPVAEAMVHLSRAAARLEEFRVADSEELLRYAVRRSLLSHDEAERVIAEVQAAQQKRMDRAADRAAADRSRAKPRPKAKPAAKPKAKPQRKRVKAARPVKAARKPAKTRKR
ncbi:MAG TPA: hypothetical protein VF037_02610 [Gemmatimonadales bacterium]